MRRVPPSDDVAREQLRRMSATEYAQLKRLLEEYETELRSHLETLRDVLRRLEDDDE